MIKNGKFIIESLCDNFTLALAEFSQVVTPYYSELVYYENIENALCDKGPDFFCAFSHDLAGDLAKGCGAQTSGVISPFCYASTQKEAAIKMCNFLKMGFNDDWSQISKNPFLIGDIKFFEFMPMGTFSNKIPTSTYYFSTNQISISFIL